MPLTSEELQSYQMSTTSAVVDSEKVTWSFSAYFNVDDHYANYILAIELWNDGKVQGSNHAFIGGVQMTLGALKAKHHHPLIGLKDSDGKSAGSVVIDWNYAQQH